MANYAVKKMSLTIVLFITNKYVANVEKHESIKK